MTNHPKKENLPHLKIDGEVFKILSLPNGCHLKLCLGKDKDIITLLKENNE